jgi:hypothetical protein
MRRALIILLLVSGTAAVSAQFEEKNAIYFGNEFNMGGYTGVDISLNYVYDARLAFRIGLSANTRIARTIPSDYSPGVVGILTLGANTPRDNFHSVHLTFGYILKLSESGTARLNLSLGMGYAMTKVPVNWQKNDGFLSENYTWDYENDNSLSFVLNPKFEFPFSRYYGLSISPMLEIHKGGAFFVVGIGHIFGLLRKGTPAAAPVTGQPE